MNSLTFGDIVQNSIQRAIVRWFGYIQEIPVIGLQLIDSVLSGYTDGICPLDNKRYFICPNEQGYYILESSFINSYEIVQKITETNKLSTSDDETNSSETSPVNSLIIPEPILSSTSPNISQTQLKSDDNHTVSPSRGILSRLVSERDQRKLQTTLSSTSNKDSIDHSLSSSRTYHPENYRSTSCEKTEELNVNQFTPCENTSSLTNTTNNRTSFSHEYPSFGHEYFLDDWTLGRVKILLENQISLNDQLCLNIYNDRNNVQNLVDEQINGCLSLLPFIPPNDIRIELIKLYDHVEMIFPSRALRLYNNDYLLLAILCSNNQCAYIRTSDGWAYSDEESENGSSILIDEISQLIDDSSSDIQHVSEQCRHLLKNACYLYYKRVE